MNKLTFPKGSLAFKKLKVTTVKDPAVDFKSFFKRKQYSDVIEKFYPHEMKLNLPDDINVAFNTNKKYIQATRKQIKNINDSLMVNNYQLTFKHPKWHHMIGTIQMNSDKKSLKDTLASLRKEFQKRKKEWRTFRFREKVAHVNSLRTNIVYNISGGVINMPQVTMGVFAQFLKDQEKQIVFSPKFPKDENEKYVGIELEFLCPIDENKLGNKLYDVGVARSIQLTHDGSIKCSHNYRPEDCSEHKGKEYGHELCIIAKESEFKDIMKKVCGVLSEIKATVNKTCGMHVHMDCRKRDPNQVYQNLMSAQNILLRMNPKSRIEQYAKKNVERDFELASTQGGDRAGRIDEGRYYAINAKAYTKHKTIEIRAHAGTIDYIKITNWIDILIAIVNCKETYTRNFSTIPTFCKRFGIINETIVKYINERIEKFKIVIDVNANREIVPEAERGVA